MRSNETDRRLAGLVRSVLVDPSLELKPGTDLYGAGLDSAGILTLVTLLEDAFDIELDDDVITRDRFATLASIAEILPR